MRNDNMKKTVLALMAAAAFVMGCGSGEKRVPFEEVNVDYILKDSTIYGFCGQKSDANVLQLITDSGDTLMINVSSARDGKMVLGEYTEGNEMAVVTNADSTAAVMTINMTTLLGDWVMQNPIDGSSEMGIRLQKGGTAESINQSSLVYKSWRLFNGQLQVQTDREDGIGVEEIVVFKIKELSNDVLMLVDSEGTVDEYNRPTYEDYGDLGIQLDWGDEADYKI